MALTGRIVLALYALLSGVLCSDDKTNAIKTSTKPETQDYCQFDAFNATCPQDSIILMRQAVYGRMKVGRCVRGDYGFLGCKQDVLRYMDQQCSGKQECKINVPELEEIAQPCPEDFKAYLEASFQCVKVAGGTEKECQESHYIPLAEESGYLATFVTDTTGFGSARCPWSLKVPQGQRVELVYYNFRPTGDASLEPNRGCPLYIIIREGTKTRDLNLCDRNDRDGHMFTSETNEVEVYFSSPVKQSRVPKYVIQYRGTGCPDIKAPSNTWIKRDGDNAAIKCNQTQETWYVTCKGNKWIGEMGNCSKAAQRYRTGSVVTGSKSVPQGILMAVIIGILLGVVIGTVLLATVFTCRRRRLRDAANQKPDALLQLPQGVENGTIDRHGPPKTISRQTSKSVDSSAGDYAYRQQTRPLISRPDSDCYTRPGDPQIEGALPPPPYHWTNEELSHYRNHEYESPRTASPLHKVHPKPEIPPVYFELDPHQGTGSNAPTQHQRTPSNTEGLDSHVSV